MARITTLRLLVLLVLAEILLMGRGATANTGELLGNSTNATDLGPYVIAGGISISGIYIILVVVLVIAGQFYLFIKIPAQVQNRLSGVSVKKVSKRDASLYDDAVWCCCCACCCCHDHSHYGPYSFYYGPTLYDPYFSLWLWWLCLLDRPHHGGSLSCPDCNFGNCSGGCNCGSCDVGDAGAVVIVIILIIVLAILAAALAILTALAILLIERIVLTKLFTDYYLRKMVREQMAADVVSLQMDPSFSQKPPPANAVPPPPPPPPAPPAQYNPYPSNPASSVYGDPTQQQNSWYIHPPSQIGVAPPAFSSMDSNPAATQFYQPPPFFSNNNAGIEPSAPPTFNSSTFSPYPNFVQQPQQSTVADNTRQDPSRHPYYMV